MPLIIDYNFCSLNGFIFSIRKDLSRIFFDEAELFDEDDISKKFFIIKNEERNDKLMSDLLKFKNKYSKILNSIKVLLKQNKNAK